MAHQNLPLNVELSGVCDDDVLQAFCRQPPTTILGMDQPRPSYLSLMQHGMWFRGGKGGATRYSRYVA